MQASSVSSLRSLRSSATTQIARPEAHAGLEGNVGGVPNNLGARPARFRRLNASEQSGAVRTPSISLVQERVHEKSHRRLSRETVENREHSLQANSRELHNAAQLRS